MTIFTLEINGELFAPYLTNDDAWFMLRRKGRKHSFENPEYYIESETEATWFDAREGKWVVAKVKAWSV